MIEAPREMAMADSFIDTNIAVYAVETQDETKREIAQQLLRRLLNKQEAVVSSQVLTEFANTASRKLGMPLDAVQAQVQLLATGRLILVDDTIVCAALALGAEYKISFWDACILSAAAAAGCDTLYSEDLNPGQRYDGVQVVNPFVA